MSDRIIAILIATFFGISETVHFGNNFHPHSSEEVICDGLVALMFVIIYCSPIGKWKD